MAETVGLFSDSTARAIHERVLGGRRDWGFTPETQETEPIDVIAVRRVKVVSNAGGGGKYLGKVMLAPTVNVPETGTLSAAELGVEGADCLILNTVELGKDTHDLSAGGIWPATYLLENAAGKRVYVINATEAEDCGTGGGGGGGGGGG